MTSSDIEKARSGLVISGYVHPKATNKVTMLSSKDKYYKIFDSNSADYDDSAASTNSNHVATNHNKYATFTENLYSCPICKRKAVYECDCNEYSEKECKKGHIWYKNKDGEICTGDPHKNE